MTKTLKDYFSMLRTKVNLVKDLKNIYGKTLANDFNSLDFWAIGENKVSEILAYFLDPNQNHSQKDKYLQLFIKAFDLNFSYSDFSKIKVICEKRTENNRRIDVFIDYNEGQNVIGIENKIYDSTKDQINQIGDYIHYLKKYSNDRFCLLYLAPKTKELSVNSITKEEREFYIQNAELKLINYEDHLIDLIHKFAIHSENERVRSFLLDFEKKITKMYIGENDLNDSTIVKNFIAESDVNIELAFKINSSMKALKDDMKIELLNQMEELSLELNIKFDREHQRFLLSNIGDHKVGFSYEFGGLIFGLVRIKEDLGKTKVVDIEELFDEKFMTSQWWAMYRQLYFNIDSHPNFWMDIRNNVVKDKMKNFITVLINKDKELIRTSA